jgi:LacI family transcriptional regulator
VSVNATAVKAQRPTIQDVASAAGVSTGTVSRVLNDRRGVRKTTRERVLAAMTWLDYQPDLAARELSFGQTTRIGLHVAATNRRLVLIPYFTLFLEHLISELQNDGYRLQEIPSGPDGLPEGLADGMILLGAQEDDPRLAYLQSQGVPFVLIGHGEGIRWVAPDDYGGGRQAAEHLLRLQHEAIVHVSGFTGSQAFFDRYQGFRDVFGRAGLEVSSAQLLDGEFTSLGAYRALRKAHEKGLRFSAVFAASDEMAIGAMAALDDLGLRVPADVSVVGFDDLPGVGDGLTTIRQDISHIAGAAVALLKEGLRGEPLRHETVPVRLVVRGTTARRR